VKVSDLNEQIAAMQANLVHDYKFTPENVYQLGNPENREIIGHLVEAFLLPGSRIDNVEALIELRKRSLAGESCLILAEHYSNFDFPILFRLMEKQIDPETAASLLPIRV
jgi:glycerol-3-phosphate O-acyltransferase